MKRMTVKIEVTVDMPDDMDPVTLQQYLSEALWDVTGATVKHSTVGKPYCSMARVGDGVPTETLL